MISISAGVRGLQILLAPADYLRVANATLSPIPCKRPKPKSKIGKDGAFSKSLGLHFGGERKGRPSASVFK